MGADLETIFELGGNNKVENIMYYVYWVSKLSGAHMPGGICNTKEKASQMAQDLAKSHNTKSDFITLPYNHLSINGDLHKY